MSGMSFKKANREATKKMKAQRKQEKRNERKRAAVKAHYREPRRSGINLAVAETRRRDRPVKPKSPPVHRAARG